MLAVFVVRFSTDSCNHQIFTAYYACKNAEMNLKSTTTSVFNFRLVELEVTGFTPGNNGEGKRRNEFAEWHVERLAE